MEGWFVQRGTKPFAHACLLLVLIDCRRMLLLLVLRYVVIGISVVVIHLHGRINEPRGHTDQTYILGEWLVCEALQMVLAN